MRLLLALTLIAAGLLIGLGDAFLAWWNYAAGDAPDIRARGPVLLVLNLPYFAAVTWVAILLLTFGVRRRYKLRRSAIVLLSVLATASVVALFYLEPTGAVWHVLLPLRQVGGSWTVVFLDAAMLVAGVALLARRPPAQAVGQSQTAV